MRVIAVFFCVLIVSNVFGQKGLPFREIGYDLQAVMMNDHYNHAHQKTNVSSKERLIGYSIYADSVIQDSADFAYSRGRGSIVDRDFGWYYDGFFSDWHIEIYSAPSVLLLFDSAHRFNRWAAPNPNSPIKETDYRKYDSANHLIRDSLRSQVYCNRYADISYDINGDPVHYEYHFSIDCSIDTTWSDSTANRFITYNSNKERETDSVYYYGQLTQFIESTYDSLGRLSSYTVRVCYYPDSILKYYRRFSYSYDSLGRISTVMRDDAGGGVWGSKTLDSFGYTGANIWNDYHVTYYGTSPWYILEKTPSWINHYKMDSLGRWDTGYSYGKQNNGNYLLVSAWNYDLTSQGNFQKIYNFYNYDSLPQINIWNMYYEEYIDTHSPSVIPAAITPSIYPNPVSSILNVTLENPNNDAVEIRIYGSNGLQVRALKFGAIKHAAIPVTDLPPGLYLIRAFVGGSLSQTVKFIKTP